jgi:hypothetical protein
VPVRSRAVTDEPVAEHSKTWSRLNVTHLDVTFPMKFDDFIEVLSINR